jgi:hypothetical protein
MLACSSSLGQLAGALARAQLQLTNPQKTLTATLDQPGRAGSRQTYRYAPLSSGLEIIRKALGEQEIAVLQTTSVAQGREALELTTTLVHVSGEWVASTWPVCRVCDVSDPKLMGAALTYARRYSLFALVGITGEDDLDAPEIGGSADRGQVAREQQRSRVTPVPFHAAGPWDIRDKPLARVRGRVTSTTQARMSCSAPSPRVEQTLPTVSASDLLVRLEAVEDEAVLLHWASDALAVRHTMAETERSALDQAFFRRAAAVGLDPEMLCAFPVPEETSTGALTSSPAPLIPSPTPAGGPDAQATL